jgi:hypothetical protein
MSLKIRDEAVVSLTPAADYRTKRGYLVDIAGTTATVSSSATVRAKGVILETNQTAAGYANEFATVALLGSTKGTVLMSAGGAITAGAWVQQDSDGQVLTDAGSGGRVIVGQALQSGVAGDLIEVAPIAPLPLS